MGRAWGGERHSAFLMMDMPRLSVKMEVGYASAHNLPPPTKTLKK